MHPGGARMVNATFRWSRIMYVATYHRSLVEGELDVDYHQTIEYLLSAEGGSVVEDPSPGAHKLKRVSDGYLISNINGIRIEVTTRMDGRGYDISKSTLYPS